jgi:mannose-6-phosphate isomerase-like protein (cupin superfamily)
MSNNPVRWNGHMSELLVTRWPDHNSEHDITEAAVRRAHQPSGHFRITPNKYPPGTDFGGTSRRRTIYILQGTCRFAVGDVTKVVARGDIVSSPEGDFKLKVLGEEELHMVSVWLLPAEFHT